MNVLLQSKHETGRADGQFFSKTQRAPFGALGSAGVHGQNTDSGRDGDLFDGDGERESSDAQAALDF